MQKKTKHDIIRTTTLPVNLTVNNKNDTNKNLMTL